MSMLSLKPHPATPCDWIDTLEAAVERTHTGSMTCRYVLRGDIRRLRIPSTAARPLRTDGLWRTTCFEVFIRALSGTSYAELNFSPSGHWAAYRFERYRQGMQPLAIDTPAVRCMQQADSLELTADLPAPALGAGPLRIAVSAVLEDLEGRICYWALQHPDGKPDFHHDAGFVASL